MNQFLTNFIPLGDTGSVCYLQDFLKDLDSNNASLIQLRINELKTKRVQKIILLKSLTKKIDFDSICPLLEKNGFIFSIYTPNLDYKDQVEIFEKVLDSNREQNICILYFGVSPALFELTIKLVLYINLSTPIEEIYTYLTNESIDAITLIEFKNYLTFLENDPYLITKPDRAEFKKKKSTKIRLNGANSELSIEESNSEIKLNLTSLKAPVPESQPLLTETEAIHFNLNSLVETEFQKEESAEEHFQKTKGAINSSEINESLSLDVDLAEEIEYISSLENQSTPSKEKISIINIDTVPLDNSTPINIPRPTIDYKSKEFLDFDAIIEEEIEQGMLTNELTDDLLLEASEILPDLDIEDIIEKNKEDSISVEEEFFPIESSMTFAEMKLEANMNNTPPVIFDDLKGEKKEDNKEIEDPVEPSQTFMVKRIDDEIKREVLNEDSKGKIPISELTKVNTQYAEPIPTNPTTPKISNPKISSPKFNPIPLDD